MKKNLTSDSCNSKTDDMWCTSFIFQTMDCCILNLSCLLNKIILQFTHQSYFHIQIIIDHLCCKSKPCNSRNIFCTRTEILLLSSSEKNRFNLHLFAHIEESGSLRSMNLMSTRT